MTVVEACLDLSSPELRSSFTPAARVKRHSITRSLPRPTWGIRPVVLALDAAGVAFIVALSGMTVPTALGFAGLSLLLLTALPMKLAPRVIPELPQLMARTATAAVAPQLLLGEDVGRAGLLRFTVISVLVVVLARAIAYRAIRALRRHGKGLEPTVIVGSGAVAQQLATVLTDHREYGLDPAGFVDSTSSIDLPLPLLGGLTDLDSTLHSTRARRVIVAYSGHRDSALADVLRSCLDLRVDVYLVRGSSTWAFRSKVDGRTRCGGSR